MRFKIFIVVMAISLVIVSCGDPAVKQHTEESENVTSAFQLKTFHSDSIGWGYDIFEDGRLKIHQPHIPAINGMQGFKSEAEAMKVAALVVNKLNNNINPPSVTIAEIDSLGISK